MTKLLENLSSHYLELLEDKDDFNVIIEIGELPNIKIFQAHSAILKYRSSYFRNELKTAKKDNNNIKTIKLTNVSIKQFEVIIKYIYGGVVLLENPDASFIFKLIFVAYELVLEELAKHLEIQLIGLNAEWLHLNFARIYQMSFQDNKLLKLQEWCNTVAVKYPNRVFECEDFTSLQENLLVSLIKRDDLQMEEVKIWNYIIKWGIAQNPGLSPNPENWTDKDISALKTTLKNCLPHIRYFQISGDDIYKHIQPYQQLLEKNLRNDIIKRHIAPNRPISSVMLPPRVMLTTKPFSKIITKEHAAKIASWINKETDTYSIKDNPYDFKLLFCGSRDGFTRDSFWKICDKQENLVVVIKVKDTDEILGGYNPIGWNKSVHGCMHCEDSFIFSLKYGTIKNSILSRVKDPESAIINHRDSFGLAFNCGLYMYCSFDSDKCFCFGDLGYYKKLIRQDSMYNSKYSYFNVEEYEIFQIHKKAI